MFGRGAGEHQRLAAARFRPHPGNGSSLQGFRVHPSARRSIGNRSAGLANGRGTAVDGDSKARAAGGIEHDGARYGVVAAVALRAAGRHDTGSTARSEAVVVGGWDHAIGDDSRVAIEGEVPPGCGQTSLGGTGKLDPVVLRLRARQFRAGGRTSVSFVSAAGTTCVSSLTIRSSTSR